MNIVIVGWYGTETIGDRAILDGIINIFNIGVDLKINLCSLYPFFSKRTLYEDKYQEKYPSISIEIFDIFDERQMKRAVKESSFVIMGGGPLMDLDELFLVIHTFEYAKSKGIKTGLIGCGYGPLKQGIYCKATKRLIALSDYVVFRDGDSKKAVEEIITGKEIFTCEDPAVISMLKFRENYESSKVDIPEYVVVNMREYPKQAYGDATLTDEFFVDILRLTEREKKVILFPMHTFFIGGDDRYFLDRIKNKSKVGNADVVAKPMSLFETYRLIIEAKYCVGMRYHSVVMETLLNGNNYIIDYTDKKNGKIASFIKDIDNNGFYKDRIVSIYSVGDSFEFSDERFTHNLMSKAIVNNYRSILGLRNEK